MVVGHVMIDVSARAGALARGGDVSGSVRLRPGGAGANAAVWAAWAGAEARLHARVGDDLPGRVLRETLESAGVKAMLALDPEAPTGTMLVLTEEGERSMVADRGASGRLSPGDLPERIEAGAVLVSGYLLFDRESRSAGRAALERASADTVALDAASWSPLRSLGRERFLDMARGATLLLANEREAEVLTGSGEEEAARMLADLAGAAVVKLGAAGAVAVAGGDVHRVRAPTAEVVDPTGAGDAFDGVLLARLAAGEELPAALEEAARAGALSVAREGAWP